MAAECDDGGWCPTPSPVLTFSEPSRSRPDPVGAPPSWVGPGGGGGGGGGGAAPAIVLDNGSFQCRAGWSSDSAPRLVFKNVIAKNRGARSKAGEWDTQVGNDIWNIEVLRWLLKTQFDRNVVVNFEVQEQIFDHVFLRLGVASQGCVDHPVVLTEPVCNPGCSRALMTELMFECYSVPRLCLGVDALFSLRREVPVMAADASAIVVSAGHHSTHVLPVLRGRLDAQHCKRINVGGMHAAWYTQRLLQLKYPGLLSATTLSRAEELLHRHGYIALDYAQELERWRSPEYYHAQVRRYQLPVPGRGAAAASAAAVAAAGGPASQEGRAERRQLQHRRLQQVNARRRRQRLLAQRHRLERLLAVQELLADGEEERFARALQELNVASAAELRANIARLRAGLEQGRAGVPGTGGDAAEIDVDVVSTGGQRSGRKEEDGECVDVESDEEQDRLSELDQLMGEPEPEPDLEPEPDKLANSLQMPVAGPQIPGAGQPVSSQPVSGQPAPVPAPAPCLAELYQMHVALERVRAPELLFQPALIGEEGAGLADTLQFVLSRYSAEDQAALVRTVLLTGGNAQYPGLLERVQREMLASRPFGSTFQVRLASEPAVSAWLGARDWALAHGGEDEGGWISRADYAEKGPDYLREHGVSNVFVQPRSAEP